MTYPGLTMSGFKYSNLCMSRYTGITCTAKTPDVQSRRPAYITAVFTVCMETIKVSLQQAYRGQS